MINHRLFSYIYCFVFFISFSCLHAEFSYSDQDIDDIIAMMEGVNFDDDEHDETSFLENLDTVLEQKINFAGSKKENQKQNKEFDKEKSTKFLKKFQDYKDSYFPKVFVVREKFFLGMTPEDIAIALDELVQMITEKPWIYVEQFFRKIEKRLNEKEKQEWKNSKYDLGYLLKKIKNKKLDPKHFEKWMKSGGLWLEIIADQLAFYSEFVAYCRVDLLKGIVFLDPNINNDYYYFSSNNHKTSENEVTLKDYWDAKGITLHHNFYALSFDYSCKLFLEAILFKDLNLAYRYYENLKTTKESLSGTIFEMERQEYDIKKYKELLDILKKRVRSDWYVNNQDEDEDEDDKYFNELFEFYDMD